MTGLCHQAQVLANILAPVSSEALSQHYPAVSLLLPQKLKEATNGHCLGLNFEEISSVAIDNYYNILTSP